MGNIPFSSESSSLAIGRHYPLQNRHPSAPAPASAPVPTTTAPRSSSLISVIDNIHPLKSNDGDDGDDDGGNDVNHQQSIIAARAQRDPLTARERKVSIIHRDTIKGPISPMLLQESSIYRVMCFLDGPIELHRFSATCRAFHAVEQLFHQQLWKSMYIRHTLLDQHTKTELMRSAMLDNNNNNNNSRSNSSHNAIIVDFENWKHRCFVYRSIKRRLLGQCDEIHVLRQLDNMRESQETEHHSDDGSDDDDDDDSDDWGEEERDVNMGVELESADRNECNDTVTEGQRKDDDDGDDDDDDWDMKDVVVDAKENIQESDDSSENRYEGNDTDVMKQETERYTETINGVQLHNRNKDDNVTDDDSDSWGLDDDDDDSNITIVAKGKDSATVATEEVHQLPLRKVLASKRTQLASPDTSPESVSLITPSMFRGSKPRLPGHPTSKIIGRSCDDILLAAYTTGKPSRLLHEVVCLLCDEQNMMDRYFNSSVSDTRQFYSSFTELDKCMQFSTSLPQFEERDWPSSFHRNIIGHGIKVYFCLFETVVTDNPLRTCMPVINTFVSDENSDDLSDVELCAGLIVGPWLLCWSAVNGNSLVVPQKLIGRALRIKGSFHRIAELHQQSLDQVAFALAKTVCRWNSTKRLDPIHSNSLHFVENVLQALGIGACMQLASSGHALENTFNTLRYTGYTGLQFEVSEEDSFYSRIAKSRKKEQQKRQQESNEVNISQGSQKTHHLNSSSAAHQLHQTSQRGVAISQHRKSTDAPQTPSSVPTGTGFLSNWGSSRKRRSTGGNLSNSSTPTSPQSVHFAESPSAPDRQSNVPIRFKSHEELDQLTKELLKQDSEFSVHHHRDYSLLMLFDRIMWEKHILHPDNAIFCPISDGLMRESGEISPRSIGIREMANSSGDGCPFGVCG